MRPHVAFGMEFRRLLDAFNRGDFRQYVIQQPGLIEKLDPAPGPAFYQDARQLVPDPFGGYAANQRVKSLNRAERLGLDIEAEPGCEAHCAQHAQMIFAESALRVADSPDDSLLEIAAAADEIEHLARRRLHQQRIDREIAPHYVLARIGFELDSPRPAAILIRMIAAKGGHFHLGVAF